MDFNTKIRALYLKTKIWKGKIAFDRKGWQKQTILKIILEKTNLMDILQTGNFFMNLIKTSNFQEISENSIEFWCLKKINQKQKPKLFNCANNVVSFTDDFILERGMRQMKLDDIHTICHSLRFGIIENVHTIFRHIWIVDSTINIWFNHWNQSSCTIEYIWSWHAMSNTLILLPFAGRSLTGHRRTHQIPWWDPLALR